MQAIRIPRSASVFILEDSGTRLQWFFENLWGVAMVQWRSNVEEALSVLAILGNDAVIFLDHDLCFADAAYPERRGSGERVARFLLNCGFKGRVYIHSVNESGARAMKKHLRHGALAPFGTFGIEVV